MTTTPMTSFWPIFASKSDGLDVVNQKTRVIKNGPTQDQLDRTPNEQGQCDYYRLIEKTDPKHIDWRKKLGGMLLREIGGKQHEDKWQQTILWDFPENYKLYEHIKTKADGQAKTVKNHSGGGHDRQDAYLYGYPGGPKKRFRSPADFFPHLLWLCTDETSDSQNCTCKMCCSVQLEVLKPPVKAEVKPEPAVAIKDEGISITTSQVSSAATRNAPGVTSNPVRKLSAGPPTQSPITQPATPVSALSPVQNQPQIRVPTVPQSTPLPQPRGGEQSIDSRYGQFICRTGEVVWYYRTKTTAWGLGLVVRRWTTKSNTGGKVYQIQPLSHPFDNQALEVVNSDEHIKPWLAWSAPGCTFAYLQQHTQLSYDQVDWNALLSGQFGEGVADVDASILAAKAIDITYTLFERVKTTPTAMGEDRHFNGIYLGAEKIWRGDPVRIRVGPSGTDLMVISDIIERISNPPTQNKQNPPRPTSQIWMQGDIYSYSTLSVPDPQKVPQSPSASNPNIPMRMREDLHWRNQMLIPLNQTLAHWRLISANARVEMADIKGRWYESSLLFADSFTKAVKNKEGGNGIWMNARGDAAGITRTPGVPHPERVAAFGNAVPKNTRLVEGLDAPQVQVQVSAQHQQTHHGHADLGVGVGSGHVQGHGDAFSLDDFMNVDHMDDASMDMGEGFGFSGQQY